MLYIQSKIVGMCVCSGQSEPRNSAFESYKKPSSRSGSQTDLNHSADQFLRSGFCLYFVYNVRTAVVMLCKKGVALTQLHEGNSLQGKAA